MGSQRIWTIKHSDGTTFDFMDIRRKVGNRVIRAYLLKEILENGRVERIRVSLRGPKNEFKDFAKFLILTISLDGETIQILAEAGVYENLRIVGTDDERIASMTPEEIIKTFTEGLKDPEKYTASLTLSDDSVVKAK